jgi:alanine racemase
MGADKLAKLIGAIPYEMVCSVADRVNRIYLNE